MRLITIPLRARRETRQSVYRTVFETAVFLLICAGKVKGLYDSQAPVCPVCHAVLRPSELQDHMEQELAKLAQLQIRYALTSSE